MDCIVYQKKKKAGAINNDCEQNDDGDWEEFDELFVDPIDSSEIQTFPVELEDDPNQSEPCTALRIEFGKSNDFYGRIIIYALEAWGVEAAE